jgi:stress response protein YsnF
MPYDPHCETAPPGAAAHGERVPPPANDSGEIETLPDGSISIPVLEEQLVVTKRVVVRERIIVRKDVEVRSEHVQTELRRERVAIEGEDAPADAPDPPGRAEPA